MSNQTEWTTETFVAEALRVIPETPNERLTPHVKQLLASKGYVHDVHVHTFDKHSINEAYFIRKFIGEWARSGRDNKMMFAPRTQEDYAAEKLMNYLNVDDLEDFYDNYDDREIPSWEEIEQLFASAEVEYSMEQGGQKAIESIGEFFWFVMRKFYSTTFQEDMLNFYYDDYSLTKIAPFTEKKMIASVLMMDFYKEFKGKIPRKTMWYQIDEINRMADKYNILPFLAVDPRRVLEENNLEENIYNLFLKAFDPNQNGRFFGVKLYPSLGFSVSDYRLKPFYEVCERLNIPIVSHCGGEMVSTFEKQIEIYYDLDPLKKKIIPGNNRVERIRELNSPDYFVPVMDAFPNLKLNIAHFGGNEAWKHESDPDLKPYRDRVDTITKLMNIYEGVYTDFSYCLTDAETYEKLNALIKSNPKVKDRIMYGTDYWVVLFTKGDKFMPNLKKFVANVLGDQTLMEMMVTTNPDKYLFGTLKE